MGLGDKYGLSIWAALSAVEPSRPPRVRLSPQPTADFDQKSAAAEPKRSGQISRWLNSRAPAGRPHGSGGPAPGQAERGDSPGLPFSTAASFMTSRDKSDNPMSCMPCEFELDNSCALGVRRLRRMPTLTSHD
jgi:hypothetical protein